MQSYTDCIPCFIRQAHEALRQVSNDETLIHSTLQQVLRETAEFPLDQTPPAMGQTIHRIVRKKSGNPDPYAAIKAESTRLAHELAQEASDIIAQAEDPLKMAIRFSIAGNIMDFALTSNWSKLDVEHFVENTRTHALCDDASFEQLRNAVKQARSILILGDNAGETVFDKLMIEQLGDADMFFVVKSSPVINDATLEDAKAAGLDLVAKLVENGSDAPGTIIDDCSPDFIDLFNIVDLVIAKGQANYETLSTCSRPLFFLTQVKCPVIGNDLNEPVGTWVIREHKGTRT